MSIEWLRDLIIIIAGIVTIGVLIFIAVLAYSIYRRMKPMLDVISTFSKLMAPLVAMVQGIRQGIATFMEFFKG
jgi:Mg2+/Co2+ transporter CorB